MERQRLQLAEPDSRDLSMNPIRAITLAVLVLLPNITGLLAAERHALVIGNGAYRNIDPLPNPPNDVVLVSDALRTVGFEVTTLKDVSKREMDQAAKAFARRLDDAGKDAVGVFYFAGHGVAYNGENWLLPVGAEISQAVDIEYESISANKVLKLMEGARNATDILVLDACRNSPFPTFSLSGTRAVSVGMRRMEAPVGSFIAYSTAPGAVAYDGDGDVSPFAAAFAAEIPRPGNSIGDMMIEVRKRVKAQTSRLGGAPQTPWDSSSLTGRFAFSPGTAAEPRPGVPPAAAPAPRVPQDPGPSADARLWATVEDSKDAAEFEFYLKRFPDGEYAELAQIRMKRLQQPAEPNIDETAARTQGRANDPPVPDVVRETAVWYDDSGLPWQVMVEGNSFVAQAEVFGLGTIIMRGQVLGEVVSYNLVDVSGDGVGYGEGVIDDDSHISYASYLPNGVMFASGQLHVNHVPN